MMVNKRVNCNLTGLWLLLFSGFITLTLFRSFSHSLLSIDFHHELVDQVIDELPHGFIGEVDSLNGTFSALWRRGVVRWLFSLHGRYSRLLLLVGFLRGLWLTLLARFG